MQQDGATNYEVYVLEDGVWVLAHVLDSEWEGRRTTSRLSGRKAGVRLVAVEVGQNGAQTETVIEEEIRLPGNTQPSGQGLLERGRSWLSRLGRLLTATPTPADVGPGEPLCRTLADYYAFPARAVIKRVLGRFLLQTNLTAFELLHAPDRLAQPRVRRLAREAAERVAAAGTDDADAAAVRQATLIDAAQALAERAERAGALAGLPSFERDGVHAALQDLTALTDEDDLAYLGRVAAVRDLLALGDVPPLARLSKVLGWLDRGPPGSAALFDPAIADLSELALDQIISRDHHATPADRLVALLDMLEGVPPHVDPAHASIVAVLGAHLVDAALAETEMVIMAAIRRCLDEHQPILSTSATEDASLVTSTASRLCGIDGVRGGPDVVGSLFVRASLAAGGGRPGDPAETLHLLTAGVPERARRIRLLIALARSTAAAEHGQAVAMALLDACEALSGIEDLFPATPTPEAAHEGVLAMVESLEDAHLPTADRLHLRTTLLRRTGLAAAGETEVVDDEAADAFADQGPVTAGGSLRVAGRNGTVRHLCPSCFLAQETVPCPSCGFDPTAEDNGAGIHLPLRSEVGSRYVTGRLLGQGGFGATYLSWDTKLRVRVAVKEYFPQAISRRSPDGRTIRPFPDSEALFRAGIEQFVDEAHTLAQFRHLHGIVEVLDFFEDNNTAYMVMEYLSGRTLAGHLAACEGGRMTPEAAIEMILPVVESLQEVHEHGVLHRDISPDNIYMQEGGGLKLLDFGAARHMVEEQGAATAIMLKRGFAPTEQYTSNGTEGPWTDVYALCATVYRAITGKVPPESTTRAGEDPLVPPSRLGIAMPPTVEAALLHGLAVRWQDRLPDMAALEQAIAPPWP